MSTRMEGRSHGGRRAAASVILAVAAGTAAVLHPAVGGASPAATEPTSSNPDVSTVATDPTTSTSTPVTSSTTTSTVPAGSCVNSTGQTVGTLPGQTECPETPPPVECQSIDPADCLKIPEVIGLVGSAGPNGAAGSHGGAGRGGASLRFTG